MNENKGLNVDKKNIYTTLTFLIMDWIKLENENQVEEIKKISIEKPVLIFKHSTRCSISSTSLNRLERAWKTIEVKPYLLDLISFRNISSQIAKEFGIEHQSPQVLLIDQGKCVYNTSHLDINYSDILQQAHLA